MKNLKIWLPYVAAVALFYVLAYMFTPQVFSGKVVNQSDIASWRGMANEIITYNESHPDQDPALWTNSMFSGMPATTISLKYDGDFLDIFYNAIHKLTGQRPPSYLLISMVGAFLLFLAFGVNPWLSIVGAVAISFASYNMQIIQVGHNSKMVAIAFMPWVLAAVVYAYRKKGFLGAILFAFALSFQIKANHPQITYYLAIIVLGYGFAELYNHIAEKKVLKFLKVSGLLLLLGGLGIASNINHLWPTYEYSKYTMRGGSELAKEQGKQQEGLDIGYATSWSYSPEETPNLFIPNFNGGSSAGELDRESATYKALKGGGYQGADQIIKQMPLYWGPQPFTAGPMYLGAIMVFLFILALFLIGGAVKWWALGVTLLAVLLSWGSNFLPLTEFFFKYIPMYNKFRTVSMVLVILQILVPLMGVLVIEKLMKSEFSAKKFKTGMISALVLTAGFALLAMIFPSVAGSFTSPADANLPEQIRATLAEDRASLLSADAFRSVLYILAAAAVLWFAFGRREASSKNRVLSPAKLKYLVYGGIGILVLADMWGAGKRYLNDSHFIKNREFEQQYALRPVDNIILEDKDPNYRVLDISINTFNDSHISYHHKTIGGYSPAKLQRYQDMIDYHIMPEMQKIASSLSSVKTLEEAQIMVDNTETPVLNMLNSKYIVIGAQNPPLLNNRAMGNCWFVDSIAWVANNLDEINTISDVNLSNTAVVSEEFRSLAGEITTADAPAFEDVIKLTNYSPNKLTYQCETTSDRVAVFSEVWYPAGWIATIDGKPAEIFRANYTLRALKVPAGSKVIEMEFRPDSYYKGATYSRIASGALLILLALGVGLDIFRRGRGKSL
ncbi:MAG: YfhO family protein [Bacteroidales bacterium]|nr:YfhO family protein [Bacteroidales bacterium]MBP9583650.1 YfhO family protein [Bacteroidales bacterium]